MKSPLFSFGAIIHEIVVSAADNNMCTSRGESFLLFDLVCCGCGCPFLILCKLKSNVNRKAPQGLRVRTFSIILYPECGYFEFSSNSNLAKLVVKRWEVLSWKKADDKCLYCEKWDPWPFWRERFDEICRSLTAILEILNTTKHRYHNMRLYFQISIHFGFMSS